MFVNVPPNQKSQRTTNENIGHSMSARARSRCGYEGGDGISGDWNRYMVAVLVGKHRCERKSTGRVPGGERVPSFPEASSLVFRERSLALHDLLETEHDQLSMGEGFQPQKSSLAGMFVTYALADQIRGSGEPS